MSKKDDWIRFLDWINKLSPWNLYYPQDFTKPIEKRKLSIAVEDSLKSLLKQEREKMAKTMIEDFRQRLKASRNIVKNKSGNEVIAGTRITLKEINSWINEILDS